MLTAHLYYTPIHVPPLVHNPISLCYIYLGCIPTDCPLYNTNQAHQ